MNFDIENEADVYYKSSSFAVKMQGESLMNNLDTTALEMRQRGFASLDYDSAIYTINEWVRHYVNQSGWSEYDKDGVSWFIALFSISYCKCVQNTDVSLEKVFKDCFIQYFQQ
ncbi:MAG: hypothetical protein ACI31F_04855 [Muribaculaceae bacterium]